MTIKTKLIVVILFLLVGCHSKDKSAAKNQLTDSKDTEELQPIEWSIIEITGTDSACFVAKEANISSSEPIKGDKKLNNVVESVTVKPNENIRLQLVNSSKENTIHNWVLLNPNTDLEVFIEEASKSKNNGYVPVTMEDDVIENTSLADPGDTVEKMFEAPEESSYKFICSYPGHYKELNSPVSFVVVQN